MFLGQNVSFFVVILFEVGMLALFVAILSEVEMLVLLEALFYFELEDYFMVTYYILD